MGDRSTDSNPDLSYDSAHVRAILEGEQALCAAAAKQYFKNESTFKTLNLNWTIGSIALSVFAGILSIAVAAFGADLSDDAQNGINFVAGVMAILGGAATSVISANGWQAKAQAAETASVTYNKIGRDLEILLAAEHLTDADLTGAQKDMEYAGQMTPNIPEKFELKIQRRDHKRVAPVISSGSGNEPIVVAQQRQQLMQQQQQMQQRQQQPLV